MPLFDTDTLSHLLRPRPDPRLVARFGAVPVDEQFMPAITLAEMLYGAHRRHRVDLLERIRTLSRRMPVVPFDRAAAERYGELRSTLERAGTTLDEADLRIASTALAYGLTLVTGNERHFRRVPGLTVENWLPS